MYIFTHLPDLKFVSLNTGYCDYYLEKHVGQWLAAGIGLNFPVTHNR